MNNSFALNKKEDYLLLTYKCVCQRSLVKIVCFACAFHWPARGGKIHAYVCMYEHMTLVGQLYRVDKTNS